MSLIKEGLIEFEASEGKISKKLEVFYNPDKSIDRDLNSFLVRIFKEAYGLKNGLELLSGSGVRGLRLAKETGLKMTLNDLNKNAISVIKKNAKRNGLDIEVCNEEANRLLTNYRGKFDYIDIDPFGSPINYLEGCIVKLNPTGGVIGITATDSSSLCGSYPKTCLRRYGSRPLRNSYTHEIGLRILIKTVIETGARFDIMLKPLFSYSRRDYFRVYFYARKGAKRVDEILKKVGYWFSDEKTFRRGEYRQGTFSHGVVCGPLWLGELWDEKIIRDIEQKLESVKTSSRKLLECVVEESGIETVGYYYLPALFSLLGMKIPRKSSIIEKLKAANFSVSKTHFNPQGIRTNAEINDFERLFKVS